MSTEGEGRGETYGAARESIVKERRVGENQHQAKNHELAIVHRRGDPRP